MLIKPPADIRSSEITDKKLYLNRREFIRATTGTAAAVATGVIGAGAFLRAATPAPHGRRLENVGKSAFSADEKVNKWEEITTYNNYYEFGTDKDSPSMLARNFKTEPWTVTVDGECNKKAAWHLEDVLKGQALEERIYRHRCVEAWSMIIPWVGFPLSDFIKKCEPTPKAKFIEFTTLYDPKQMPGVRSPVLRWPYVEGLRLDEAMHPLTILAVGLYGEVIPNQDGAPLRLVVPWKYGFKHIKSIVKIKFVEKQPLNTWQESAPQEYGFYSNVNPTVDHPRWTQASERRIGEFLRRKTLMFNGYGDQVAGMYSGMDLKRNY
ncbi:MAG: protein-methionine-sulfoxide reductase catalytic subunit MsrP [Acidobacteria bacterium]|nr:MAG: protein-methionine-sulfoxide reductase catalytic subunit MsrP [Acidobacteriota bacterium]PYR15078.1 MAG: protein-methionine-sulfoxide reductase catalytic subunit MsrP [Acidobacteriota bacterium]PYR45898.1 MAG: protein-methionine-sulfoxide reductase catalytic subunit MsrP [Acidobacteriota bacterium]